MVLERTYWQGITPPAPPFVVPSPNLIVIEDHILDLLGGQPLSSRGSVTVRPIRDGDKPSTHSHGGARDWRYENVEAGHREVPRQLIDDLVLPWMIEHHEALYIQQIHDYLRSRIWRCDRHGPGKPGWKFSSGPGMGESWAQYLHTETNQDGFFITASIAERMIPPVTGGVVIPPQEDNMSTRPVTFDHIELSTATPGPDKYVAMWQAVINWATEANMRQLDPTDDLIVDGYYGSATADRVEELQRFYHITVDRKLGPQTAGALLAR